MRRAVVLIGVAGLVSGCGLLHSNYVEPPHATVRSAWVVAADGSAQVRTVYELASADRDVDELTFSLQHTADTDFHEIGARRVGQPTAGSRQVLTYSDVAIEVRGPGGAVLPSSTRITEVLSTPTITLTLDPPLRGPAELTLAYRADDVRLPDGRLVAWPLSESDDVGVERLDLTLTTPDGAAPPLSCIQSGYRTPKNAGGNDDEYVDACTGGRGTVRAVPEPDGDTLRSVRVLST